MGKLEQLMEKKASGAKEIDPAYKDAKMNMLKALRNEMSQMISGDLKGAKKVEVQSDSPEGLADGLDKAKDIIAGEEGLDGDSEEQLSDDDLGHGADESFGDSSGMEEASPEASHEEMDMSDEDMAHLEAMLAAAKAKRGQV